MRKVLLPLFALLITAVVSNAQSPAYRTCDTDEMWKEAVKADPDAALRRAGISLSGARKLPGTKVVSPTGFVQYKIPVVFHVMHTYGPENISKAQILDAVNSLNLAFQKLNADTGDVIPLFQSIFANAEIGFELANIDPDGNCTDGITRTYTKFTNAANDNVKTLVGWPCQKYLNIWVVKNIASGAAGYAYYPGISASIDGIVMRHDYTGSFGTSNNSNYTERSLSHEVGHWLNLPHTWGSTNNPGLASNCGTDDGIGDTPNTIGVANFSCNTAQNTCGQIDNVQNYMDYASCHLMFTEGQKDAMHVALQSSPGGRDNLSTLANLVATGTESGHVLAPCAPKADFAIEKNYICVGNTLTFNDKSWNGDVVSRTWYFSGGTPSTDTSASPAIFYNTPGVYDVKLVVTNSLGTDSLVRIAHVNVLANPGTALIPFSEGFEALTFAGSDWEIVNQNNNNTWAITSLAAATGTKSARVDNITGNSSGSADELLSPIYNFTNYNQVQFSFKVAFASRSMSDTSELRVYFSTNCGDTWSQRYFKRGSALSTANAQVSPFIPNASQWRTEVVSLSSSTFTNKPSVRARIEYVNYLGNNIYIDDINISGNYTGINDDLESAYSFNVFPNPATDAANINFDLPKNQNVKIDLYDVTGRLIKNIIDQNLTAGEHQLSITNNDLNGIYLLRCYFDNQQYTNQISFIK
jgi:PKD repeat protein